MEKSIQFDQATQLLDPVRSVRDATHLPRAAPASRIATSLAVSGVLAAAVVAGLFPIGMSMVIVFLLAGPHNWFEARYMLGRLPARWGKLRGYFVLGLGGVLVLTCGFAALPWVARTLAWSDAAWSFSLATWNSALILWVATLVVLRGRQNPRRSWELAAPISLVLVALNWLHPLAWSLVLVYVHPLLALWFLDRELTRQGSAWRDTFRRGFWLVPISLAGIIVWNWHAPDLPGDDVLSTQITRHAGAEILTGVSTHLLVALHTFLELLHYGVWIVAIPLASGAVPWKSSHVPLARRSNAWRQTVWAGVVLGAVVVVGLWAAFLAEYPLTRDIYFTVALVHVLAEVPFLLRLL